MSTRIRIVLSGLALVLLAVAPASASAREEKVARAAVPKAAVDSVLKKYRGARLETFAREEDDGEVLFEIELVRAGRGKLSVDVTAAGRIRSEEETIPPSELPASVKAALPASKYKGWKIVRCERVVEREDEANPTYELLLRSKSARVEVVFDQNGKVVKEEPKSPDDRD